MDLSSDENNNLLIDNILVTPEIVKQIYREFLGGFSKQTIRDVIQQEDEYYYDWGRDSKQIDISPNAKRIIYGMAIKKPHISHIIRSLYLLAIKYDLSVLGEIKDIHSAKTIKTILPTDLGDLVWIEYEQLLKFYKTYKTNKYKLNTIQLPKDLLNGGRNS